MVDGVKGTGQVSAGKAEVDRPAPAARVPNPDSAEAAAAGAVTQTGVAARVPEALSTTVDCSEFSPEELQNLIETPRVGVETFEFGKNKYLTRSFLWDILEQNLEVKRVFVQKCPKLPQADKNQIRAFTRQSIVASIFGDFMRPVPLAKVLEREWPQHQINLIEQKSASDLIALLRGNPKVAGEIHKIHIAENSLTDAELTQIIAMTPGLKELHLQVLPNIKAPIDLSNLSNLESVWLNSPKYPEAEFKITLPKGAKIVELGGRPTIEPFNLTGV